MKVQVDHMCGEFVFVNSVVNCICFPELMLI